MIKAARDGVHLNSKRGDSSGVDYVCASNNHTDLCFSREDHTAVDFKKTKLALGELIRVNYIGIKSEVVEVTIFVGSVPLVANSFNGC